VAGTKLVNVVGPGAIAGLGSEVQHTARDFAAWEKFRVGGRSKPREQHVPPTKATFAGLWTNHGETCPALWDGGRCTDIEG